MKTRTKKPYITPEERLLRRVFERLEGERNKHELSHVLGRQAEPHLDVAPHYYTKRNTT
jgi:hypothetical protein